MLYVLCTTISGCALREGLCLLTKFTVTVVPQYGVVLLWVSDNVFERKSTFDLECVAWKCRSTVEIGHQASVFRIPYFVLQDLGLVLLKGDLNRL